MCVTVVRAPALWEEGYCGTEILQWTRETILTTLSVTLAHLSEASLFQKVNVSQFFLGFDLMENYAVA